MHIVDLECLLKVVLLVIIKNNTGFLTALEHVRTLQLPSLEVRLKGKKADATKVIYRQIHQKWTQAMRDGLPRESAAAEVYK